MLKPPKRFLTFEPSHIAFLTEARKDHLFNVLGHR